jgi:hypothetical protein
MSEISSLCECARQDAERYPYATDRVIVPTAKGCPIHDPKPILERFPVVEVEPLEYGGVRFVR